MDVPLISDTLSHVSADWLLIAIVVVVAVIDALRSGMGRAFTASLSLPIAALIFSSLPHALGIGAIASSLNTPIAQAVLFIAILVATYVLLSRALTLYTADANPIQAVVAALGFTALLLVVWTGTPALSAVWHFGSSVSDLFAEGYRFWWILAGYAMLAFANR